MKVSTSTASPAVSRREGRRIPARSAWWIALVLAVTSIGLTTPAGAADDPQTVISLTFDDGNADQLAAAALMKAHDMPGTFYINSGTIGMAGFFTRAQLEGLDADGNEVGGHTLSHTSLPSLPTAEAKRQICLDRANLTEWGFSVRSFAYPFAETNAAIQQLVEDCGYNSGRNLGDIRSRFGCDDCDYAESFSPDSPFETKALDQVESTWTLQDFKDAVTNAESSGGGWVQLTFHNFCGDVCGELSVTQSVFSDFLAWLEPRQASHNTIVKTVGDVIGGPVKPVVTTPDPDPPQDASGLNNPSLESISPSGMPTCWQPGGYGVNNPTFDTVSPGRTGQRAGRVTMTDYEFGDAKLLPSLDLGTCAPPATPGKSYVLRGWYTSTALTQFDVYLRTSAGGWTYWTSSPWFGPADDFTQATWTTDPVPAGFTGISFGLNIFANGTLVVDDFSLSVADEIPDALVSSAAVSPGAPDGAAGWYVTQPRVTLTRVSGPPSSWIEYSLDGGDWTTYESPIDVSDGTRSLRYRAVDDDQQEATHQLDLLVDTVKPVVTPTFDQVTRELDATATDATSKVSTIERRDAGGDWEPFDGPVTLGDGATTVDFRATDKAGNVSTTVTLSVPAALTASATVVPGEPDGAAGWYVTRPQVTLAQGGGAGSATLEYSLDGGSWTAYAGPIEVTDGERELRYRAADGDVTGMIRALALTVDTTKPTVNTPAFDSPSRTVSVTATDATSTIERIEQRVGDGDWATYAGPVEVGDDATTVDFRAFDKAGNQSTVRTIEIPDRQSTPTVTLTLSPSSRTYGKAAKAIVTVPVPTGAPIATGTVTVRVDGKPLAPVALKAGQATVTLPSTVSVGKHTITATYSGDGATKPGTSAGKSLTVKKAKPSVSIKLNTSKAKVKKTHIKVTVKASVAGTTIKPTGRLYVRVNGKTVKKVTLSAGRKGKITITLPKLRKKGTVRIGVKLNGSKTLLAVNSARKKVKVR